MKIRSVRLNNRRRACEIGTWSQPFLYPYTRADPPPTAEDPIVEVFIDVDLVVREPKA